MRDALHTMNSSYVQIPANFCTGVREIFVTLSISLPIARRGQAFEIAVRV